MLVLEILEHIKSLDSPLKFFHPSSSEVFGKPSVVPQDESTPHFPLNPYGCAKSFATNIVRIYRERYGLFAVNGIMYNHESPRRGKDFVTRKITRAAAAIKLGLQKELLVGDISSKRDWGYAPDYVQGMWLSLQASEPDDYVFATGELHSVQDVIKIAFSTLGLSLENHIKVDPNLVRISDPSRLVGNSIKALQILDWKPKVPFKQIIEEMTLSDLDILTKTSSKV
jgi:GDPmannose 4,6-dehydratase